MKGKPDISRHKLRELAALDPEQVALLALGAVVSDPDRMSAFLAATGLDPSSIRTAASQPGFLPAVLDHVASDESLLLAVAAEMALPPEALVIARHKLSPEAPDVQ